MNYRVKVRGHSEQTHQILRESNFYFIQAKNFVERIL